uniref:uncharacterized protein LOC120825686 isoform X3 n=1 Tax=Gasterosteus aculeatus aculeatus TaxID=481459 RepID=UPI001A988CCA|nr:uncharacterized protein LOC120825686 isoform X3 [Gasterosteus aculeatus aculeatus]
MNPVDWNHAASESLQRSLIPDRRTEVNSRGVDSITSEEWRTFCRYARRTVDEAQSLVGGNVAREELRVPSRNFYVKDAEVEDPDGESLEVDEEDPELKRKRKELREIEEQIMFKRAAIALKTVEPLLKKTTSPDFFLNESATCNVASLKDRVNLILQRRHPSGFLSTVRSPKERMNSSSLIKNGLLRDDHPLKLRVKALIEHRRFSDSFFLPAREEAPDLTPPAPCRSNSSPDNEDVVHKGFQRFLSILNEGVDMDFLSRIVNDDHPDLPLGEELLNVEVPAVESMSDPTFRRASQQSDSEASVPGCHRANGEEGECDKPSQERSLGERLSPPANDDEERSRSKSPAAVKKKEEEEEEEEEKPEVDEQRAHLQNILQSLGLSLEVEEMSKLADRTRERLYGKKHEGKGLEQEIRQRAPQRHYSKSSSSSSSSSRSSSRSNSPNPARRRSSHSRQRSECGRRSSDRRADGLACHVGSEDRKEEPSYGDHHEKNPKEMFSYQQNHTYSQPAAPPAFPQNSFYQSCQYTAYHSGSYGTASSSHWTSTQVATPPFFYTSGPPYPQNTYQHSPAAEVPPVVCDPYRRMSLKKNRFWNPDLPGSGGQTGSFSGNRCLQFISTKQPTAGSCVQEPPPKKKKKKKKKKKNNNNVKNQQQKPTGVAVHPRIHAPPYLDTNLFMNPDLSGSEGQIGFFSRKSYLQTVNPKKPTAESRLQEPPKSQQKQMNMKTKVHLQIVHVHKARKKYMKELRKLAAKQMEAEMNTPQPVEDDPEAEQSGEQRPSTEQSGEQQPPTQQPGEQRPPTQQPGEQRPSTEQSGEQRPSTEQSGEQRPPTEEEIKANLRKKLKAFNLKMKQKVPEPGYPLTSPTGEICGSS